MDHLKKKLSELTEEDLKNILALNIRIPYQCPKCKTEQTIPIGNSACNTCGQAIDCQFD